MPLKTRVTLLVMVAAMLLVAAFAAMVYTRELEQQRRLYDALLQRQQLAWIKLRADAAQGLDSAAERLISSPAWQRAWRDGDARALDGWMGHVAAEHPGWRLEVFDHARLRLASTQAESHESMIDELWLARVLGADDAASESAMSQPTRHRFDLVSARGLSLEGRRGVITMAQDARSLLPELAAALSGEIFLVNLRGAEVAGTRPALIPADQLDTERQDAHVSMVRAADGRYMLAVLQPMLGQDGRRIGALVVAHDVDADHTRDVHFLAWGSAAGAFLLLGIGVCVFVYLRGALRPLERSVQVLSALAQGDLRATPDEEDQALADEAGQIARGVAALRDEMLNLQMLRDERVRTRQQQERLIRHQLKLLAESLDEASREDILRSLEPQHDTADGEVDVSDNDLAELARTLGRMSGLVARQQSRLVGLLRELQQAIDRQAVLVSLQQELEIARTMQLSILPRHAPSAAEVEVAALMIPAHEVGGDFYDYFMIDADHLAMVVADVSGKGIPAAFFMAIARTLFKSNALFLREPAQVVTRLNEQLCAENEQMMFVTAFFAVLDLRTGVLDFVNAGHNPPVIRHADDGAGLTLLPRDQNTAVAVVEGLVYRQGRSQMRRGDTLLLYTDGVTEAVDREGRMFGEARLLELLRQHQPGRGNLPREVLNQVRVFEDGAAQADDITCISLRYLP